MAMRFDDSGIHIACEAKIVGINNQLLQSLKYVQLDGQELFWIGPEIL